MTDVAFTIRREAEDAHAKEVAQKAYDRTEWAALVDAILSPMNKEHLHDSGDTCSQKTDDGLS